MNYPKCSEKKINILIASFSLLLLIFVSTIFFITNVNANEVTTYKSIKPIERSQMMAMSPRSALELLIQQDNDMYEYANKPAQGNIDKLFETFYHNLKLYTGSETIYDSKLQTMDDDCGMQIKTIEKEVKEDGETYTVTAYKLTDPKTDLIALMNDGEGSSTGYINHDYLAKRYSKYLSNPWKEYLRLRQIQFNDLEGYAYYIDGYPHMTFLTLKWYTLNDKFINKYPNFPYTDFLKQRNEKHIEHVFGTNSMASGWERIEVSEETKKALEDFLKNVSPNNPYYKKVKLWYEGLLDTNFKITSQLLKTLAEKSENQNEKRYYLEEFNKYFKQENDLKEEDTEQPIEDEKYDNANFSRDEMKQGYEFAERIKQVVRNKDIVTFADFVSYPITIRTTLNDREIEIQNKEELIDLGAERVFDEAFTKEVCRDEDLFVSYRGFMMGNGPNLFFTYEDDGLPKIYALNISR